MKVTVIGRGLIGGSLEMAARKVGHTVAAFDRGETPDVADADVILVAVPPSAVRDVVLAAAKGAKEGATIVDMTGVKGAVMRALAELADSPGVTFVGGHPMAGKEKTGLANAEAGLFAGASMILVPFPDCPAAALERLDGFFRTLGFAETVVTDAEHHDEMIAFTSQLCHLISSAYVREPLAKGHVGYSAGSFRDLSRVGAPDPEIWTELFFANREALLKVLDRYLARLEGFREALAENDPAVLKDALKEGVAAKAAFGRGLK